MLQLQAIKSVNSKNTICKGPEKTTVDPALKVNKIQNT